MTGSETSGKLLVRNTLLNFVGQVLPLLAGLFSAPFVLRGLGAERFGLLSLAWIIMGYFLIFDLGLGNATTKYVAEALGRGNQGKVAPLVWTTVTAQAVFGLLGAVVMAGITPLLVGRILNIPPALTEEAKGTFYVLAVAVPVILISNSVSGVLRAIQRFDLLNGVRILSGTSTYLLPVIGLVLDLRLPAVVALILLSRCIALSILLVAMLRLLPSLRAFSVSYSLFPRLFTYGSWVMITSIVGPVLLYLDRFLVASLLSVAALAYYSAPYDAVTRLSIIPTSLTMSLFPAFSALEGAGDRDNLEMFFARSLKYVLLAQGPIVLMIVLFAREILQAWLGNDFATRSASALQLLALGVLINSLGCIPFVLLQGIGRPDITAKLHLLELPVYLGSAWVLVSRFGIVGAAAAWALRMALDTFLLFVAAFRVCQFSPRSVARNGLKVASLVLLLFLGMAYPLRKLAGTLPLLDQGVLWISYFGLFVWVVWKNVFDSFDRETVAKAIRP